MAFMLNQGAENVWASETETAKEEISGANMSKGFQKNKGSVFPAKRKLVKTMMVHSIAKSLSSLSVSPEASSKLGDGSSKTTALSKSSKGKKRMEIFPDP